MSDAGGTSSMDRTDEDRTDDLTELDDLTDEQVMERVAESWQARRELESVWGLEMLGGKNWSEGKKLAAFMGIFHPDHPATA